jgi:hypothetical protein
MSVALWARQKRHHEKVSRYEKLQLDARFEVQLGELRRFGCVSYISSNVELGAKLHLNAPPGRTVRSFVFCPDAVVDEAI